MNAVFELNASKGINIPPAGFTRRAKAPPVSSNNSELVQPDWMKVITTSRTS